MTDQAPAHESAAGKPGWLARLFRGHSDRSVEPYHLAV
jgi:hypothetical protein